MLELIISIVCSVLVGVIFKAARKSATNLVQIIVCNYAVAIMLCIVFFAPILSVLTAEAPWALYVSLGILLPIVFISMVKSVNHVGIVRTDAAQRLALFIPLLASWLLFDEIFSSLKVLGILCGFGGLFLIFKKNVQDQSTDWKFPLIVLLGYGIIDVMFKKVALFHNIPYTTSLAVVFIIAFCLGVFYLTAVTATRGPKLNLKDCYFGIVIGILNFLNILFYLKAHKIFSANPSTVFAGMNMGVILIGSLIGVVVFKEKLSKTNLFGLFLALLSIVIIAIAQNLT